MKNIAITCAALVAIACVGASEAEAGGFAHIQVGSNSYSFGTTTRIGGGYSYTPRSSYPVVQRRSTVVWRDTSYYDVIPGGWEFGPTGLRYRPTRRVLRVDGHYETVPSYTVHTPHTHVHFP